VGRCSEHDPRDDPKSHRRCGTDPDLSTQKRDRGGESDSAHPVNCLIPVVLSMPSLDAANTGRDSAERPTDSAGTSCCRCDSNTNTHRSFSTTPLLTASAGLPNVLPAAARRALSAGHSSRFVAKATELPACTATARSMQPMHSAISAAITSHLSKLGSVRLLWETPIEQWLARMTHREAVRVIAEIDAAPSAPLTTRRFGLGNSRLSNAS
jgi:hypothetical protein